MSVEEKLKHLTELNNQLSAMGKIIVDLRDAESYEDADKLQKSADQLSLCIEELEHQTLDDWIKEATFLQKTLMDSKKEISLSLDIIKKDMKIAKSVTKALGAVEKAIRKILGTVVAVLLFFIYGCSTKSPTNSIPISGPVIGFVSETSSPEKSEFIIDHGFFKVSYNKERRLANYVVYRIKREQLTVKVASRKNNFVSDPILVKSKLPFVDPSEYIGTGYDRGHLAPSADFAWDQKANNLTFVMSNMAPQSKNLNRDAWRRLEDQVRRWGCGEKEITIITGPILSANLPRLKHGLEIPQHYFKIVIDETPPRKVLSFIYSQTDKGDVLTSRMTSLDKVSSAVGMKLNVTFPSLKDFNTRLPASINDWKSEKCY